jgi:hypothetical protein
MILPPKPTRKRPRLVMMHESAAVWYWIARFIRGQVKAENVWRQPRGIPFCHMPISQGEYLAGEIDTGRNVNSPGTLGV